MAEDLTVVLTVKAYPQIGAKTGETVCMAGIRIDREPYEWVRLWPVPFRDLDIVDRFRKYEVLRLRAERSELGGGDQRPESWMPVIDSIRSDGWLDSKRKWAERRQFVEPVVSESMCDIQRRQARDRTSLGAFRPAEVMDWVVEEEDEWDLERRRRAEDHAAPNLLRDWPTTPLEQIPYAFRYSYRCSDRACRGHRMKNIDWELGESFRNWRARYSDHDELMGKIRQRYFEEMCRADKDTVFFTGNIAQYPRSFVILGVFWPPA